jgi:hypothetical protein
MEFLMRLTQSACVCMAGAEAKLSCCEMALDGSEIRDRQHSHSAGRSRTPLEGRSSGRACKKPLIRERRQAKPTASEQR